MKRVFDLHSINNGSHKCEQCSKPAAVVFGDYDSTHLRCLDRCCRPKACPDPQLTAEGLPVPCLTEEHAEAMKKNCCSDSDPDLPDLPTGLPPFDERNASVEQLNQRLADIDWALRNTRVDNRLQLHRSRMIAYRQFLCNARKESTIGVTIVERNLLEESAKYVCESSDSPVDKKLCNECMDVASKFVSSLENVFVCIYYIAKPGSCRASKEGSR